MVRLAIWFDLMTKRPKEQGSNTWQMACFSGRPWSILSWLGTMSSWLMRHMNEVYTLISSLVSSKSKLDLKNELEWMDYNNKIMIGFKRNDLIYVSLSHLLHWMPKPSFAFSITITLLIAQKTQQPFYLLKDACIQSTFYTWIILYLITWRLLYKLFLIFIQR